MKRPLGITIVSAGMILAGIGCAGAGVLLFFMGSSSASATAPENGALAALFAALGAAGGVIFLLFGALQMVLAIAIFQLRSLARLLTIFLFLLIAAGACLGLVATLLSYSHIALLWNIFVLVLDLLALGYLLRPATKEAFSRVARGS